MTLSIRVARADDDARLRAIYLSATMSSYGRELRWLEPILSDPATALEDVEWTIVASEADQVLGYAAVTRNHLENLFIDPAGQSRGVGAALLAEVEARVTGSFDELTLHCLCINAKARRFYDRQRYLVRETRTVVLHGHPLEAWRMAKRLEL